MSHEDGAEFAKWFTRTAVTESCCGFVSAVPLSRIYEICDEARRRSKLWENFAMALASRANGQKQGYFVSERETG